MATDYFDLHASYVRRLIDGELSSDDEKNRVEYNLAQLRDLTREMAGPLSIRAELPALGEASVAEEARPKLPQLPAPASPEASTPAGPSVGLAAAIRSVLAAGPKTAIELTEALNAQGFTTERRIVNARCYNLRDLELVDKCWRLRTPSRADAKLASGVGVSEAIRRIVGEASTPLTIADITSRLQSKGYDTDRRKVGICVPGLLGGPNPAVQRVGPGLYAKATPGEASHIAAPKPEIHTITPTVKLPIAEPPPASFKEHPDPMSGPQTAAAAWMDWDLDKAEGATFAPFLAWWKKFLADHGGSLPSIRDWQSHTRNGHFDPTIPARPAPPEYTTRVTGTIAAARVKRIYAAWDIRDGTLDEFMDWFQAEYSTRGNAPLPADWRDRNRRAA